MNSFFNPLFSTITKNYKYDIPFNVARNEIEIIFDKAGSQFGSIDMYARFTGGYTFEMESMSAIVSRGGKYRSTLFGILQKDVKPYHF